jgi:hypothetical protein
MLVAALGLVVVSIGILDFMKPYSPTVSTTLNIKGYNFARGLSQLSLAVANEHVEPVLIKSIKVNGVELRFEPLSSSQLFRGSEAVFAPYGGWRCSYIVGSQCVIPPRGITNLYIGIAWEPGTVYNIALITDKGVFTFKLTAPQQPTSKT